MFWSILTPFMNDVTKNKVLFVSGKLEQKQKIFSEFFNLEELEATFGGGVDDRLPKTD